MATNEELFRRIIEEGYSDGDVSVIDEIVDPAFEEHQYGMNPTLDGLKKSIRDLHHAFPDFSLTIEAIVNSDDTVWARSTAQGTHEGDLGSIPATGKQIEVTVFDVGRFEDGKLVEHWGVPDRFAMMKQLGMKQPPKRLMKLLRLFSG